MNPRASRWGRLACLGVVLGAAALGACGSEEATENTTSNGGGSKGGTAGAAGAQAGAGQSGNATAGAAGAGGTDVTGGSGFTSVGGSSGSGGGTIPTACPQGTDAACNDGNPCTTDRCAGGGCVFSPALPGTSCDTDADVCNGVGTCQGTVCTLDPATKIDPADKDLCTDDLCDAQTGKVTNPPKVKPSDSTLCTAVLCDPATGKVTTRDLANDADPCTFDECSLDVGPINTPKPLGDGDPCTVDSCDKATGLISHTTVAGCGGCKDNAACDDGNPCTNDVCKDGLCEAIIAADGASCDNQNLCDGAGTCKKGVCFVGPPPKLSDDNPCTKDTCDPQTGAVTHTPIPDCKP